MRKKMQTMAIIVAFSMMTIGTAICAAQPGMMVGNFRTVSNTDETVAAAAKFAVATQSNKLSESSLTLISVISAQRQIVAGSNYQMCLSLKVKDQPQQATATVYLNLQNEFSLSTWVDGNCGGKTAEKPSQPDIAKNSSMEKSDVGAALAPDAIVRNLYAAQKANKGPFSQTKNRPLVDKYFTKEIADLIWKDATTANGEVGALDGDPLYNAQDLKITFFKIGKPEYGEGNIDLADVPVTFKNMGKDETILFRLERGAVKTWKISNIFYPGNESTAASLKAILSQ